MSRAARSERSIGFAVDRDGGFAQLAKREGIERAMAEPGFPFFIEWAGEFGYPAAST